MTGLRPVSTDRAPAAIGPYSQAIVTDGWIFVSGQIPIVPSTGEIVTGDIAAEARQVLMNLGAIIEASGGTPSSVVRTTIYLTDMTNFQAVNEVYAEYFGTHRPARATVAVAGLPRNVRIEIDAVARVSD